MHSINQTNLSSIKLLDTIVHPARHERQGHNTRDVHLRPKNVHAQPQLLADGLDVPQPFLVIGSRATDPDLDLVLEEEGRDFAEGADDAFEGACHLSESQFLTQEEGRGEVVREGRTFVKLAIPPPMNRTLPSGFMGARIMRSKTVRA